MSASRTPSRRVRRAGTLLAAVWLAACGSRESEQAAAPAQPPAGGAPAVPADLPRGIVLALAQFKDEGGKSVPGAARLEFVYREGGAWKTASLEDEESNVFHKALAYDGAAGPRLLSLGGTDAVVKAWAPAAGKLESIVDRNGNALLLQYTEHLNLHRL